MMLFRTLFSTAAVLLSSMTGRQSVFPLERPSKRKTRARRARAEIISESPRSLTPLEHAEHLVVWMQRPGGLTGDMTWTVLYACYREMVAETYIAERHWNVVAAQLRKLLRQTKRYVGKGPARIRVWFIPPLAVVAASA